MTKIILIVLFIAQLLSFYFILLLNSKISKFKLIEQNQEKLVSEMEDTFSVYLLEMKEENDRLIREMAQVKTKQQSNNQKIAESLKTNLNNATDVEEQLHSSTLNLQQPKETEDYSTQPIVEPIKMTPKSVAANAYKKNAAAPTNKSDQMNKQLNEPANEMFQTFESKVVQYYKNGMSVEDIAKKTQKGKTEIELLIKFHA